MSDERLKVRNASAKAASVEVENMTENVSRRGFLKGAAAASVFVLAFRYSAAPALAAVAPSEGPHADHSPFHPNVYLGIDPDGTVYIVAHRSEMGTTSGTSLPMILADELDAEWRRVKLEQAIGDANGTAIKIPTARNRFGCFTT